MAILKMKHLRLAAMTDDREALLNLFQRMGCVEVSEPQRPENDPLWAALTAPETGLSAARECLAAASQALVVLKRYAPEKGSLLKSRTEATQEEFFNDEGYTKALRAAQRINEAERHIRASDAQREKLKAQKAALAPWLPLDVPLDIRPGRQFRVEFGTIPLAQPAEEAAAALREVSPLVELTEVSADREFHYCMLVCHADAEEALEEPLRALGWSQVHFREWTGTAAENDHWVDQEIAQLDEGVANYKEEILSQAKWREGLKWAVDHAGMDVQREEAKGRLLDTARTFLLEGWVPEENWPQLRDALAPYPVAYEVSDPAEEDYPSVPVRLKNNWFTSPMNMVTEMYSLPAYGSLDPNPLMAPFFILFYGMMMADMGYGILMMLAGLIVVKKARPKGTMDHMFRMVGLCGVTTFLFGAVTGGFFGDLIPQLLKVMDPESTFVMPALFTPVDNTLQILIGALALGVVQIFTGMAISFYKKLRDGQALDALFEEVTWWAILIGLALAILGVTPLLLIAGGALLLAGCVRTGIQKGGGPGRIILSSLVALGGALYNNITGYFQDILSYSRLMALMLSGAVVAQVFNTLGSIPGNVVVLLVISMIGNLLNFALNLLGCYVHDMRLQCLEYFNRFYQDGGKPFRPLDYDTKYVEVQK